MTHVGSQRHSTKKKSNTDLDFYTTIYWGMLVHILSGVFTQGGLKFSFLLSI